MARWGSAIPPSSYPPPPPRSTSPRPMPTVRRALPTRRLGERRRGLVWRAAARQWWRSVACPTRRPRRWRTLAAACAAAVSVTGGWLADGGVHLSSTPSPCLGAPKTATTPTAGRRWAQARRQPRRRPAADAGRFRPATRRRRRAMRRRVAVAAGVLEAVEAAVTAGGCGRPCTGDPPTSAPPQLSSPPARDHAHERSTMFERSSYVVPHRAQTVAPAMDLPPPRLLPPRLLRRRRRRVDIASGANATPAAVPAIGASVSVPASPTVASSDAICHWCRCSRSGRDGPEGYGS